MAGNLPRLIIASSGTSIVTNYTGRQSLEELDLYSAREWAEIAGARARLDKLLSSNKDLALHTRQKKWGKICAEINTMMRLDIDPARDEIVLLATETAAGRFCAEKICRLAGEHLGWSMSYIIIEDLQVRDSDRFERRGVRNYLETIIRLHEKNKYSREVILIPTGGFKGVVPYTALLGMIYKIKMYYIFEDSTTLLELPWLPVDFEYGLIEEVKEKMAAIDSNTAIPADVFWKGIAYHERHRYMPLIWEGGGEVSLSGMGLLLWDKYKQDFPPDLVRDDTPPAEKRIKLCDDHHGKDRLQKLAERLVKSPYVRGIINSEEFRPYARRAVEARDGGQLAVVLTETDCRYSLVAQTTGRDRRETEKIGWLLQEKLKL